MNWQKRKLPNGITFERCETKDYVVQVANSADGVSWSLRRLGSFESIARGDSDTVEKAKVAGFVAMLKDRRERGMIGK